MERDRLWLCQGRGRREVVGELEVGRAVPLDHYPNTFDWLVSLVPGSGAPLCAADEGLVLRPRVEDLSRHPAEVADTDHDVVLWTIPRDVFVALAAGERESLCLRDFIDRVGDGEPFYLGSAHERALPLDDDAGSSFTLGRREAG
jgi:hypothetical protein